LQHAWARARAVRLAMPALLRLWSLVCLGPWRLAAGRPLPSQGAARPRLHAVTYADDLRPLLALPMASGSNHGIFLAVVGLGRPVTWGTGLGVKANVIRDFIFNNTEPDDVVVVVDAFDVLFQGSGEELLDRYLAIERRTGRTLIFSAETMNSYPEREADFPRTDSPWRYLNSGVVVGRSRALRDLFKEPLPAVILDRHGRKQRLQNWHTDYFLDHQQTSMLDTQCEIAQTVFTVDGVCTDLAGSRRRLLSVSGGKLLNEVTGTTPIILHFAGPGHWPDKLNQERFGTCCLYEVFRSVVDPGMARMLEEKYWGFWKDPCTHFKVIPPAVGLALERAVDTLAARGFWLLAHKAALLAALLLLPALAWCLRRWRRLCRQDDSKPHAV